MTGELAGSVSGMFATSASSESHASNTNNSHQVVTAWEVFVTFRLTDGSEGRRGLAREGYAAFEGAVKEGVSEAYILPGASVRGTIPLERQSGSQWLALTGAEVAWLIFADGSSWGDPERIDEFFRRRADEGRGAEDVAHAMRAALSRITTEERLAVALEYLTRLQVRSSAGPGLLYVALMKKNVEGLIAYYPTRVGDNDVTRILQEFHTGAERRRAAAEKHSRRLPPPASRQ